jgi:hypothetical protein
MRIVASSPLSFQSSATKQAKVSEVRSNKERQLYWTLDTSSERFLFTNGLQFALAKDDVHACFGIGSEFLVLLLFKPFSLCYAQQHPLFSFLLVPGLGLLALFARVDCLLIYLWIYQYTHTHTHTHKAHVASWIGSCWVGQAVCYEAHMYGAAGWLGVFRVSLAMGCMYR